MTTENELNQNNLAFIKEQVKDHVRSNLNGITFEVEHFKQLLKNMENVIKGKFQKMNEGDVFYEHMKTYVEKIRLLASENEQCAESIKRKITKLTADVLNDKDEQGEQDDFATICKIADDALLDSRKWLNRLKKDYYTIHKELS